MAVEFRHLTRGAQEALGPEHEKPLRRSRGQLPRARHTTNRTGPQVWLCAVTCWTEMGLLRPDFVPPKAIRDLRDYTRARTKLVHERTRCWQRLENCSKTPS